MRRLQLAALLIILSLGLGSFSSRLAAYVTNGHAWGVTQVQYYVNPTNLYVPQANAIAAIQSAASNWNTQSGTNVQLVYAGQTSDASLSLNNVNEIFFRNDSSGYIAETYWWYDGTGHLIDSDTVFHENYKFYTGNAGCNNDGYYVENVSTHEFGHFLGMAHSTVASATMWPSGPVCQTSLESLDPDDIAGIQSLYPAGSVVTAPSTPAPFAVSNSSSSPTTSLALAWGASTNASGYKINRSSDGVTYAQVAQVASSAVSFVDAGLASNATYYYRVSAYNNGGTSPFSNMASGHTQAVTTPPTAPASPSPANNATGVNTSLTLSWASTGAQTYDAYVYVGTSVTPMVTQLNLASPSVSIGSLASGTTYSWKVVAKNSIGATTGPTWRFTTKSAPGKKK